MSNAVKNEVIKKTVYGKLVAKGNNIDTSGFVLKSRYNADKRDLEEKDRDTSKLVKKSNYNVEVSELENKILSISDLVITSALTAVGNKIPSVSNLVKKQIRTQKLVSLRRNLLIINMTNILLLQNLIS